MTGPTPLDAAHAAMSAAPGDDALRLAYWGAVADSLLFLLLAEEAAEDRVVPRLLPLSGLPHAFAFDREDRLAAFAGGVAPYAGLPGRALLVMLAGQGVGLVLNAAVADHALAIGPADVDWLAQILAAPPERAAAAPAALGPPPAGAAGLAGRLAQRLGELGLGGGAVLAAAEWPEGRAGLLLAVIDAPEPAETAIAASLREAALFSGAGELPLDIAFLAGGDPALARIASVGLRLSAPPRPEGSGDRAEAALRPPPAAPPAGPGAPPRLGPLRPRRRPGPAG